ncbi:MAG: hypothetical protein ABIG61_09650 [Planctomycetota bacterium]
MDEQIECLRCGGQNFRIGSINATGKSSFRMESARFFQWRTADVDLEARTCLDCGYVELTADRKKTLALI